MNFVVLGWGLFICFSILSVFPILRYLFGGISWTEYSFMLFVILLAIVGYSLI